MIVKIQLLRAEGELPISEIIGSAFDPIRMSFANVGGIIDGSFRLDAFAYHPQVVHLTDAILREEAKK